MDKIAVFVNDAEQARHILTPMLAGAGPSHWVIVACPPTLTRHIGRWVSQAARRQWLERWSAELFAEIEPLLGARAGSKVEKLLARRPLVEVGERLQARLGSLVMVDARRPRLGKADEPVTRGQPAGATGGWAYPVVAATGLAAMLTLAD